MQLKQRKEKKRLMQKEHNVVDLTEGTVWEKLLIFLCLCFWARLFSSYTVWRMP